MPSHSMRHHQISILMPAFNTGRYLEEAIESVLAQDGVRFEILVADDNSRDNTRRVMQRYRRHPHVKLFYKNRHWGAGRLRNFLLSQAKGEFVSPVDSDDILLPNALLRLSGVLIQQPRVHLVYGDCLMVFVDEKGKSKAPPALAGVHPERKFDLLGSAINHGGCLMRKRSLLAIGGYDERPHTIEDFSMLLRFQENYAVKYLAGEVTYLWRRHPESDTQRHPRRGEEMMQLAWEAHQRRKQQA